MNDSRDQRLQLPAIRFGENAYRASSDGRLMWRPGKRWSLQWRRIRCWPDRFDRQTRSLHSRCADAGLATPVRATFSLPHNSSVTFSSWLTLNSHP